MFQLNLKQTGVLSNSNLLTLRSMAKHNMKRNNIAIKKSALGSENRDVPIVTGLGGVGCRGERVWIVPDLALT